jgi:hypothetical protein
MAKLNPWFGGVCLLCLWLFVVFYLLNVGFWRVYSVPFGMSDLDNYRDMFLGLPDRGTLLSHGVFIFVVNCLGGFSALVWFVPLCLVVNLVLLFWLYRGMGFQARRCFYSVLWFVFGSFYLLFFGFTGLLNQLFSLVFVLAGLNLLFRRFRTLAVVFALCSCLVHYMNVGFWFLLVVSELLYTKRYNWVFVVGVLCFVGFGLGGYRFFVPFSFYPVEPPLYLMWSLYTMPLLWVYLFFSYLPASRYRFMVLLLFCVSPWFHLGRYMVFLHILVMPYAYQGYRNVRRQVFYPGLFWFFNVLLFVLYVDYGLSFAWHSLIQEAYFRGLSINTSFLYYMR